MSLWISFSRGATQHLGRTLPILAALLALSLAEPLHAQVVVVPGAQAGTEGDQAFDLVSMRYQQLYDSSAFGALSGPSLLTAIAFRLDGSTPLALAQLNVQVNLSTTSFSLFGLQSLFSVNIGSDETTIFSGSLTYSSTHGGGSTAPFDLVFPLATPFLFNPAAGNLLLDVRIFSVTVVLGDPLLRIGLDAQDTLNSGLTGSLRSLNVNSSFPDLPSPDRSGLVTRFTFTPSITPNGAVPEPSTYGLVAGAGLLGLVVLRRRKARCG